MKKNQLKNSSKLFQTGASYLEFIFIILLVVLLGIPALRQTGFEVGEAACKGGSELNKASQNTQEGGTQAPDHHFIFLYGIPTCNICNGNFEGAGTDCTPPGGGDSSYGS